MTILANLVIQGTAATTHTYTYSRWSTAAELQLWLWGLEHGCNNIHVHTESHTHTHTHVGVQLQSCSDDFGGHFADVVGVALSHEVPVQDGLEDVREGVIGYMCVCVCECVCARVLYVCTSKCRTASSCPHHPAAYSTACAHIPLPPHFSTYTVSTIHKGCVRMDVYEWMCTDGLSGDHA